MKNYTLSIVLILFGFVSYAYNGLYVREPRQSWYSQRGSIEEATLSVKPVGMYMEYGLYLTFSAKGSDWNGTSDSLEIEFHFDLPKNSFVTDSWLWIGDEISQAKILDKWTASSIYENTVQRRTDPSLLLQEGINNYVLKIFPMAGNQTRKVKITYLVPVEYSNGKKLTSFLPYDMLKTSFIDPKFYLLAFERYQCSNPSLLYCGNSQFESLNDPELGNFKKTELFLFEMNNQSKISFDFTNSKGYFLYKTTYKNENYYQLNLIPDHYVNINNKKKILFLIDYELDNSYSSKELIFNELKTQMLDNLRSVDSFNIMLSNWEIKKFNDHWISATPENIEIAINTMSSQLGNFPNMASLLFNGCNFITQNGSKGDILLIANSNQFDNYIIANDLIKEISKIVTKDINIHISDFQSTNFYYQYINEKYYSGNEYLYTNLSKLAHGTYAAARNGKTELETISEAFDNLSGDISFPDFYVKLDNGYTFARFDLNQTKNNIPIHKPVSQIGKYVGYGDFKIDFAGQIGNDFFNYNFNVGSDEVITVDSTLAKIWNGMYITELQLTNIYANNLISEIIDKSLSARVLSYYTAFICLEDTTSYCSNCIDETDVTNTIDNAAVRDSILLYPNPFANDIEIEIHTDNPEELLSVQIFDLQGYEIYNFDILDLKARKVNKLKWDGKSNSDSFTKPGVYILVYKTKSGYSITKKLIKIQ